MIGSFVNSTIAFIVAKNWTRNLSQLFKDLQGSNSEFKLVTLNLFLGPYQDYFETILGLFWDHLGLFWDYFGTIWDYFGTILEPFWCHFGTILGSFLIILRPFWDYFGTILGLFWDHFGTLIILIHCDLFLPTGTYCDIWGPILTLYWVCLLLHLLLLKRGPKAPRRAQRALGARRAPQPSAGARRRGAERPELLVLYNTRVCPAVCVRPPCSVCPKFYILLLSLLFSFIYPTVSSSVIHF